MKTEANLDTKAVLTVLNRILELELAGVVRYLHYSFMIFGPHRIPICAWLRSQSDESVQHAVEAGEHVTSFGGHPSLKIGELLESHKHSTDDILGEAHEHEQIGLAEYRKLLELVANKSVMLEEYARAKIATEEQHLSEIEKMRKRS